MDGRGIKYNNETIIPEGEFIQITRKNLYDKGDLIKKKDIEPLLFGVSGSKVELVNDLKELGASIRSNWEQGKKLVGRESLNAFVRQFDESIESEIKLFGTLKNVDAVLFRILYTVDPNCEIMYRGRNFGDVATFIGNLDGVDDLEGEVIKEGLFEFFLEKNAYEESIIHRISGIIRFAPEDAEFVRNAMYNAFNRNQPYVRNGIECSSLTSFVQAIDKLPVDAIDGIAHDHKLYAWLYNLDEVGDQVKGLIDIDRKEYLD
jgi:hypothetical protein